MKFKNPKGEVIEVSVPAGFVEAKASGHWTHQDPLSGVVLCNCTNFTERLYLRLPHTHCYCTDNLHGESRVPSIQEAQSKGQSKETQYLQDANRLLRDENNVLSNELQRLLGVNKRRQGDISAAQEVVTNQRIELKNLNAAFDDFKREAAKSNRNLLEVRDDLRKEVETKSARIKELELAAAVENREQPKGQWWYCDAWGKWLKAPKSGLRQREMQNLGYQIKFIPEGEAFLDQEAHESAIRRDEREKCNKENGSLREDIGEVIATIDARSVAAVAALNDGINRYDQGYCRGISNAYQYAIDQLKTIVAKDQP